MEALCASIQSEQGIMLEFLNNFNNGIDLELNKSKLIDKYDTIENDILNLQSTLDNDRRVDFELLHLNNNFINYCSTSEFNSVVAIAGIGGDLYAWEKEILESTLVSMSMELVGSEYQRLELSTEEKPVQSKLINKGKSFQDQKKDTRFMNKRKR